MNVIISVTTTQARLSLFFYGFQSLTRQKFEKFRIVVNLSKGSYLFDQGIDSVPDWMAGSNVEVNFVENIGSYRKLIPLINNIGDDDLLVTADDDVLYPENWLASLVHRAIENPDAIICGRARIIQKNIFGRFQSYANWELYQELASGMDLLPTGCAGVVYRRPLLDLEFLSDEAYLKCAPTADDIWFRFSSLRKGTPVIVDPEIDKRNCYIRHFMGLQEVNLHQFKGKRRLHQRLIRKIREKIRHYFGLSPCENDVAWAKALEYSSLTEVAHAEN